MTDKQMTLPENKTLAKKSEGGLRSLLYEPGVRKNIQDACSEHMTGDRMARVALTALTKTPKLEQCTPKSFMQCILDLASVGLEPDGERAHVIPYGRDATLVIDYKGYVELAFRSGKVLSIHCDVVCEGDVFRYSLGKVLEHTPWAFRDDPKPEQRGEVRAAYCVVEMVGGASHHEVMTREQIDGIRARSKAGKSGPWVTDYDEMAKKTAFRRARKWLPMTPEIKHAEAVDSDKLPPVQTSGKVEGVDLSELLGEQ